MRDDTDVSAVRHAVGRPRSIWGGLVRTLAVLVAVVLISSVSVAAYGAWRINQKVVAGGIDLGDGEPEIAPIDGAFNVLLVGADNAVGQKSWGAARDATLNDVNILVHVSADHTRGTVVSLPRDLIIPHPQCEDPKTGEVFSAMAAQPLNEAFSRGGLRCVVNTVESVTGLNIPYAALFSFEGTVKMADAVGGVEVCTTKAIDDPDAGLKLKKGRSTISGRTALAYLRSRHGVGDQSDLSRIASQQAYMSSLMRKMTSSNTLSDPTKLYALANAAADNVKLSKSLAGIDPMVQMALALKNVDLDHLVFVQYPVVDDPVNHNKVVPNAQLAPVLMDRVLRDRPIALGDDALGLSTRLSKSKSADPTPSPSKTTGTKKSESAGADGTEEDPTIAGLRGQTAAQRTCSIAS
ncbi:LCP family protein [Amnibacterium endophyticum]|uniref:LCP family protein n=1 Tax=Amnibacterium endophyticum TaxID=2109337 RepID=A0ABW4LDK6_9MICO